MEKSFVSCSGLGDTGGDMKERDAMTVEGNRGFLRQ